MPLRFIPPQDDALLSFTVGTRIRMLGVSLDVAANGKEAVDMVAERHAAGLAPYDLIVMDNQVRSLLFCRLLLPLRGAGWGCGCAPTALTCLPTPRAPQMPIMSGAEAIREMRARGFQGTILGITGDPAGSPDRIDFECAGLDLCVDKTTEGMRAIESMLREHIALDKPAEAPSADSEEPSAGE